MSCTCTDTATLAFTLDGAGLTTATTNQWKIKVVFCKCVISHDAAVPSQVTQLSCDDETVASQQGCFQYHTGITGKTTTTSKFQIQLIQNIHTLAVKSIYI